MARFTLVISSKNYSSWSLRPWIAARHAGIDFDEVLTPLDEGAATRESILSHSPGGLVPILKDAGITIWESLAIPEYLAEDVPEKNLWPANMGARAHARIVSAEMHPGFTALRRWCPMNCRKRYDAFELNPETLAETVRIAALWRDCRERFGDDGDRWPYHADRAAAPRLRSRSCDWVARRRRNARPAHPAQHHPYYLWRADQGFDPAALYCRDRARRSHGRRLHDLHRYPRLPESKPHAGDGRNL